MTILRRIQPTKTAPVLCAERIACPRCATINCTRHNSAPLTTRTITNNWRGA